METKMIGAKVVVNEKKIREFQFSKEIEKPILKKGSKKALIKILYGGVNAADYKVLDLFKPIIPGTAFCGKIVELGTEKNHSFKVGDLVMGETGIEKRGTFAQYGVFNIKVLAKVPEGISPKIAAALPIGLPTAVEAFRTLIPEFKDFESGKNGLKGNIMIIGASGGVGGFLTILCKHYFGCKKVFGVSSSRNHEYIKKLGIDVCIDYKTENFESYITEENNISAIIDAVGSKDYQKRGLNVLKKPQKYILVGAPEDAHKNFFNGIKFMISLKFSEMSGILKGVSAGNDPECLKLASQYLLKNDLLKLLQINEKSIEKIHEVFVELVSQRTTGKTVIKM